MKPDPAPIGVLLAQLGTPDEPTPQAVRPYLREFLSDMRIIDYHPLLWQPILRGIILRVRPRKSAALYKRIWLDEGSPLLVYSQKQVAGLQDRLGEGYRVVLGMTYGQPSIRAALDRLEAEGIDRIIVLPMYPQYSSTTTASVYDAVYKAAAGRRCPWFHERKRFVPTLRFVPPYYDHPGYIAALAEQIETARVGMAQPPEQYVFSFHGIPKRYARTGDPYPEQCTVTAQLLGEALGLADDQWRMTFQSQFGPEKWLEPDTEATIEDLPAHGVHDVLVACPGFTADCLETVDEIGNEAREAFEEAGGDPARFSLAPCLNDNPTWLEALAEITRREASGWQPASIAQARQQAMSQPAGD
ncbi:MAG: ferrochelatase [Anaerolineales bacterium]